MPTSKFDEIRSITLFKHTSDASFNALMRGAYIQNFPPHTELITEGDSADFLHIISSGIVELFSNWAEHESCMALLRPHATFILAATIKDRPYLMSGRTLTKARVILIPSENIRAVFETDVDFSKSIVTELAGCYREAVKNMKNIKLRTSVERLANYLVKQAKQCKVTDRLTLDIEKKKIASFLGMTPENLSRAFAALKSRGVVVKGETILLNDYEELVRFSRPSPLIDN